MKNLFSLFIFLVFALSFSQAQNIQMEKKMGSYQFSQDGSVLNPKQLVSAVESHPEAFLLAKKGKNNNLAAAGLGLMGGVLLGIPVGTAAGGGEASWEMVGVGAGVILLAFPFAIKANKQFVAAVESYNQSLGDVSPSFQPQFSLLTDGDGIGLQIRF